MAKRTKKIPRIRGSYRFSLLGIELEEVRAKILQRRLQLLVHSHLYYCMGESLVSDNTWDKWARELVYLQEKYPKISARVDYYQNFKDFVGSTGFDLPYLNPEISLKAKQLLKAKEEGYVRNSRHSNHRKNLRVDVL